MDPINEIMTAKNFTEEQAINFHIQYEGELKVSGVHITLYEFIQKNGGVSPIILQKPNKQAN